MFLVISVFYFSFLANNGSLFHSPVFFTETFSSNLLNENIKAEIGRKRGSWEKGYGIIWKIFHSSYEQKLKSRIQILNLKLKMELGPSVVCSRTLFTSSGILAAAFSYGYLATFWVL